ncbi:MAG: hypothetical protein FWH17_08655 [Oscillospiraceae bacterium]|nr:hypothetical protein [Oscillospiraceae bacterium]
MKGFDRLSHAYIADGETAENIAMAALCNPSKGLAAAAKRNPTGDLAMAATLGKSNESNRPCRVCFHCDKAARMIHPDITYVKKHEDKREILVDQIRELKRDVYIAPSEAERKAYVVCDADTMNDRAQNAFLQILEEPPPHAVFILKTSNPAALLPTVRSRCIRQNPGSRATDDNSDGFVKSADTEKNSAANGLSADTSNSKELEISEELASTLANVLDDNAGLMRLMFRLDRLDRISFTCFITQAQRALSNTLRQDPHKKKAVLADLALTEASEMLRLNVSTGHIAGMLCASLVTA